LPEKRYVRYADTVSLTRLLEPLDSGQVLQLCARRSQFTRESEEEPYKWVKLWDVSQYGMTIDFLSLWHGRFVKKDVLELLESTKLADACVQTLDVLVKDEQLGRAFAELLNDPSLRRELEWVAHFEEYPIRREQKDNEYTRHIREVFEQDDGRLGKLGFEPASLDLKYVLPLNRWKEVVRRHLSRDYHDQVQRWIGRFPSLENNDVRRLATSVFPREMCRGREYEHLKGNVWQLVREGDI
jgi:hypothetical protein